MIRVLTPILLFTGTLAAQDNPALPVVKAAIEAHGGMEALKAARTARSSLAGTMISQGREMKFTATGVYSVPDKYRMEILADLGTAKLNVTQILNGKKTKVITKLNGTEKPVDPRVKDETIQAGLLQDVSTLTPLLDPKKYTLKLEKEVELNGNPASVVSVTGNGLKEVKLFFDKKSGRLVKTLRRGFSHGDTGVIEVNEESYFSDFKPFGKATLPTAVAVNHDGKKFMTMTMTELKFLDKVDDKDFAIE